MLSSTNVFNIDNNKKCYLTPNQYEKMISKGSCDAEDWSNYAENFALLSDEEIKFENILKKIF